VKLLLALLACLLGVLIGLPLMVGAVVATHPWLAVGALNGPIQVRPSAVRSGVPADQWPLMVAAAKESTCHVGAEDLAAIAAIESNFGQNLVNPRSGAFGYGDAKSRLSLELVRVHSRTRKSCSTTSADWSEPAPMPAS